VTAFTILLCPSSSAKAGDPVFRASAIGREAAAYWIPAFAGYDANKRGALRCVSSIAPNGYRFAKRQGKPNFASR
jgi:hypothetical protein